MTVPASAPSGLPAISPTRGESGKGRAPRFLSVTVRASSLRVEVACDGASLVSPLVGEMAGRPEEVDACTTPRL
ncbi:hypothetical protein EHS39_05835 [Ensifer sp. MPMI2T]|nr:hypothetical protein EHS39_05835 [Ensifer sp. MPMI2T]